MSIGRDLGTRVSCAWAVAGRGRWPFAGVALAGVLTLAACAKPDAPGQVDEAIGTSAAALSYDAGGDAEAPASPSIGSFAVYATEAFEENSGALVTGCNVGVEGTSGPFLGGGAAAYFNSGATIQSTETLYAYSTYLNSGASLGPVDTDHVMGNSGASYGPVSAFPAMPAPPTTPAATAGTTSVTLNSGASRTLAPGAYAGVTVNSGAKLSLSGGKYVFSSLTLNSGGTMTVSAATTLSVTGSGSFGSGSFAGPASGSGLTAKSLVVYFDGSSALNLNSGAQIQALVIATNAKVTVNTSKFTGAIAAAQILMNSGATVTCQDGFGSLVAGGSDAGTPTCSGSCDDGNPCTTDACVAGTCTHTSVTNGTACSDGSACTQTDTCQSGVCTGTNPVTCTASDACHVAGTCDTTTGVCSNPTAANGTACNDGNACTQTDACQAGVCTGSSPVTCTASDQCHVAGTCDPSSGVCSNPTATNGTACNDGNACTQTDACQAGICTGTNPVVCVASGQCFVAGTCDTLTGACTNPPAPNGTSCSDGNACTQVDTCQSGSCIGGNPVSCTASDQCHAGGTCDPTSGACSNPAASNGTACNDNNACTTGDSCQSGACVGASTVTCTASDQCHVAGTCDPTSGTCSNPVAANGTGCNDGNACTQTDSCESGTCVGGNPVSCAATTPCHLAGTCDPSSGTCSSPLASAGSACANGACGGTCNATGTCIETPEPASACSTSTCSPGTGVTPTPNTCVPSLNGTVATNLASMVTGAAINPVQVALVRGRVLSLPSATPFAGVSVSVLGHPEYGTSTTAADGTYAIGINGGGQVTVAYAAPPGATTYLPVQRHTPTQWQQYAAMPDVYLTPIDPNVSEVALASETWQAASGSTITDPADENAVPHTARVFFPSGTTASFAYGACGSTAGACGATCAQGTCTAGQCVGAAPSSLTVRLTEYTVGATGQMAMPAELPPSTGYTYAVELSADEELAAGASGVEFNQAVSFYVDDFLGFGAAQSTIVNPPVPVGFYDRTTGTWIPSTNGAIIEITAFTGSCPGAGCVAVVNEPTGDAGTAVTLSSDELAFLGQAYGGGSAPHYLWRITTTHFSGGDLNWPYTLPSGAGGPPMGPPGPPPGPDPLGGCPGAGGPPPPGGGDGDGNMDPGGSIIDCRSQILAQQVPVPGTPYFLRYQSERAPGRVPAIQIPLTGSTWPPATLPLAVNVQVGLQGETYNLNYAPSSLTPNQTILWTWDQKDAFGNTVEGLQLANVTVSYTYQGVYTGVRSDTLTSASFNSVTSTGELIAAAVNRTLNQATLSVTNQVRIGVEDAAPMGLGGWTISPQHTYDPDAKAFWGGDGTRRTVHGPIITTLPGVTVQQSIIPVLAPDGALYETNDTVVDAVDSSGNLTSLAGGGSVHGPYAACTSSVTSQFASEIQGLAADSAGLVYEAHSSIIDVIDPVARTIRTIAGQMDHPSDNGIAGCTDAAVATQGTLSGSVAGLAVAPDGSVYVADLACDALRRIGADGSLRTLTGHFMGVSTCTVGVPTWAPGQLALNACVVEPTAVAVMPDGSVLVASNQGFPRIDRIDPKTGVIANFAGSYSNGRPLLTPFQYDGQSALTFQFSGDVLGIAVGPDGTVYASDRGASALYAIDPAGVVHLVAGGAPPAVTTEVDNGPAVGSLLHFPDSVAVHPNGSILVHDYGINGSISRVREVAQAYPSYAPGTTTIPSLDGTEAYVFGPLGQHLSTVDPVTGATLRTFAYDAQNRLTSIIEARGGTTTLAYSGTTVTITPPFSAGGQQTTLTLDQAGGHAITMTTPAGEATQMTYANGLMMSLVDAKSNLHTFAYDPLGRLTSDTDPTGAVIGLQATTVTSPLPVTGGVEPLLSWTAARTSAAGHVMTQQDYTLSNGTIERNLFAPSGAANLSSESNAELWTGVAPDGTITSTQQAADPQFGMLDPYPGTVTRVTPSGLTYSSVRTRTSTGPASAPASITDLTTLNGQPAPWSSVFTGSTRQWLYESPAKRESLLQLDALGRVSSVSFPGTKTLPTASYVYDADGRIQRVTVSPNANGGGPARVTSNTYDAFLAGYLATTQDSAGDVTTYDQRDQDGRVLDVQLPDFATVPASHVATTYDPNGNITSITVPPATSLPSTHTFTSTPVDLPASYTPPQVSSTTSGSDPKLATLATSYAYNPDRQLTTTDAPEGTSYAAVLKDYDAYGRLGATYDPLSNVTASFTYLLNASSVSTDQVAAITTSDGITIANTYDGFLKRKTAWSSSTVTGSVSWTYDDFFRPSTLQVGTAPAITFAYDLDSLYVGTSSPAFTVTRDQTGSSLDGLPYASTLGTVSDAWTYDGFGAQSSYTVKTSDGTVLYAMYGSGGIGTPITRDALGRITAMNEQINGATHAWLMTYDTRGRLESVTEDGTTQVYAYDPNGNLTQIDGVTFGTYDAQDRMVTFDDPTTGSWVLSYTNNGDLSAKTGTSQDYAFDYDLSSNLRSVQVNAATSAGIAYAIDGLNRRVGRSVTPTMGPSVSDGLLYDQQRRVVAELDGSNDVLSTFIYGLKPNVPDYMVRGGVAYRIVSDWRGDARLVLDTTKTGAAAIVERVDYDAWGNVTKVVDPDCTVGGTALCWQPFGFAGGIWDVTTGVVRFGARDYDPAMRRWSQKDPIGFDGEQDDIYAYVANDPMNGGDPSGLDGEVPVRVPGYFGDNNGETCSSSPFTLSCGPALKDQCPCGPGTAYPTCQEISGYCQRAGCSPCKQDCQNKAIAIVANCYWDRNNNQLCLAQGWYYFYNCADENCD